MDRHHCEGFKQTAGNALRYIAEWRGRWIALACWQSGMVKFRKRDRWMGEEWKSVDVQKLVGSNTRLVVLGERNEFPGIVCHMMREMVSRIGNDWAEFYGSELIFVESLVGKGTVLERVHKRLCWSRLGSVGLRVDSEGQYTRAGKGRRIVFARKLKSIMAKEYADSGAHDDTAKDRCASRVAERGGWKIVNLFAVVERVVLVSVLATFVLGFGDRLEARTVNAWRLTTNRASGSSGKIEALKHLNSEIGVRIVGWNMTVKKRVALTGIDLSPPNVSTSGASVTCRTRTYLRGVDVKKAVMDKAILACTDLQRADLREADLRNADLRGADLRGTDLRGAELSGARLEDSVIHLVEDQSVSSFRRALGEAVLNRTDLRGAKGLTCGQLVRAIGWNEAYRNDSLACHRLIPVDE